MWLATTQSYFNDRGKNGWKIPLSDVQWGEVYEGGSKSDWPIRNNVENGDKRQYLSMWGGTEQKGYNDPYTTYGGCCSSSTKRKNNGWNQPFEMYFAYSPVFPLVTVRCCSACLIKPHGCILID